MKYLTKKKLILISAVIQGIFSVACLFNIVICLIYQSVYNTEMGRLLAEIALHLPFILFIIPAMPVSIVLNICAKPKQENKTLRVRWLTWTVLSPILYVVIYFIMLGVFISSTGGV